jgi:hypothetical protein
MPTAASIAVVSSRRLGRGCVIPARIRAGETGGGAVYVGCRAQVCRLIGQVTGLAE